MYMHKDDLALNNLQWFIYHNTNKTKPKKVRCKLFLNFILLRRPTFERLIRPIFYDWLFLFIY